MPDWLILTLKILAGPLLGAVIGYFTNLIAVKMLFRPKKAKYIGKLRLPFTPGLIPKRKSALARALGNAVATRLVTASDMQSLFAGEEAAAHAGELAANALFERGQTLTLSDIAGGAREKVTDVVMTEIENAARSADFSSAADSPFPPVRKMQELAYGAIKNKLVEKLPEMRPAVSARVDEIFSRPIAEQAEELGLTQEKTAEAVAKLYREHAAKALSDFAASVDIAALVTRKVEEMETDELESLLLSVMKKELGAIVNLGALLGAIVGIFNSLLAIFL